jgi:hypothetical protein
MTDNKDWCQVPDQLVQSFAEDHKRSRVRPAVRSPRWPRWKSAPSSRPSSSRADLPARWAAA